jgi:hypothetical protein
MSTIPLGPDHRIRPLDHLQWVLERRSVLGGGRWKGQARQLEHAGERWLPYAYCPHQGGTRNGSISLTQRGHRARSGAPGRRPAVFP